MFESQNQDRPSFRFTVPGAPVPKARGRTVRPKGQKVRTITPASTANFEATVKLVAASARPAHWPMHCEYKVSIHAVRARRGRGDNSNIAKAVEDACNTILWADDVQIAELHVTRDLDRSTPRTEVTVEALPVACESCGAVTLYPNEKRCSDCHAELEAKRAKRARRAA